MYIQTTRQYNHKISIGEWSRKDEKDIRFITPWTKGFGRTFADLKLHVEDIAGGVLAAGHTSLSIEWWNSCIIGVIVWRFLPLSFFFFLYSALWTYSAIEAWHVCVCLGGEFLLGAFKVIFRELPNVEVLETCQSLFWHCFGYLRIGPPS